MKKLLVSILICGGLLFSGCASPQTESSPSGTGDKVFHIGITQFAEHPALDAVREGFIQQLEKEGIQADIDYKNAQTDVPMNTTISQKFAQDKKDLVLAITTLSAQGAKAAITDIPVLFSAVTDPLEAELVKDVKVPGTNLSGTNDAAPIEKQLGLFQDIQPGIKTIGILYNTGEANSLIQIRQAEEIGEKLGLTIETIGITNVNEIPQAMDSLLSKVDGVYVITDNIVASAINVVAGKANEKGIVTVGAVKSFVEGGILITDGIDYKELGIQTAKMAKRILVDQEDISKMPVESLEKTEKVVNMKTLKALSLDENAPVFDGATKIGE